MRNIPGNFLNWVVKNFPDSDLIDIEAYYDSSLNLDENKRIFLEKFKELQNKKIVKPIETPQYTDRFIERERNQLISGYVNKCRSIAIIGNPNTGKTSLAKCMLMYSPGKKYLLGYPVHWKGIKSLADKEDLYRVRDCTIFVDELSRYFPVYERRSNQRLIDFLIFCEHTNTRLIFTTQLTQFITRQIEGLISAWAIKQINIMTLKNGCIAKMAIRQTAHPRITTEGMQLKVNEFLWYNLSAEAGENGVYLFPEMGIGKDWN